MLIEMQFLAGEKVTEALEDLASLRLNIFREYPYLYAGVTIAL